jgi:hypothetical protein
LREFARRNDALAGVEFALILPFLVSLGLGVNEFCRYTLIAKRATTAAASIAQIVASTNDKLDQRELQNLEKSGIVIPNVSRDAAAAPMHYWGVARVNISSIRFKPTNAGCVTSNCAHEAHVLWAWGWERRACGKLTPVADTADPSPTTIPKSLIGPGSVVSVEFSYRYTPIIGAGLFPATPIKRTAYLAPRYVGYADLAMITHHALPVERCTGV